MLGCPCGTHLYDTAVTSTAVARAGYAVGARTASGKTLKMTDYLKSPYSRFAARLNYRLLLVVSAIVCLMASKATWGLDNIPSVPTAVCREIRIDFDDGKMPNASKNYQKAVAQVLTENRFDDLDCLADDIRQNKTRFASGV